MRWQPTGVWLSRTGIVLIVLGLAAAGRAPDARIRFENTVVPSRISFVLDNGATPQKHQIETMIAGVAASTTITTASSISIL